MSRLIENRTYDEIKQGDSASLSHTLTQRDIQLFAVMSGDVNPAHVDEEYARSAMFHRIIGHGMWTGAMISTVLGTQLPGPGTIYLDQSLHFVRPVSEGDRVTATVTVLAKEDKGRVRFSCVCTNQKGEEVVTGEALVIAPEEKVRRKPVPLPMVELKTQRSPVFDKLLAAQKSLDPLKTAIVHPCDALSLGGALAAMEDNIIIPVLVGPKDKIVAVAKQEGWDISKLELIDTPHSHAAAAEAMRLANQGEVEAIMKGKIHTDELMHAALDKYSGLRTGRRMSHVFALDFDDFPRPLFITDAALNIHPTLMEKRDIVQNAVDLFTAIGLGTPKVAILSAVETVNEKLPSTLDATALCKMAERGQITGALLDGPLAFDNAISEDAARAKGIVSQVAGQADILVVPDVESGNMLYKQMRFLSGAEGAGIVMGAKVPIILTSRASGELTRKASCALALIYLRSQGITAR